MSATEPERPAVGPRTRFARFCAAWLAALFVAAPVKMAVKQLRQPSPPELPLLGHALLIGVVATVAFVLVRMAWRATPHPDDAAPMGWAEWLFHWVVVAGAMFYLVDGVFELGVLTMKRN
jgi:hypothetical protein